MADEPAGIRSTMRNPRPMLGIAMKIGSVTAFVASSGFIKMSPTVPLGEQLFIRSAGALALIVFALVLQGRLREAIQTRKPFGHLWRAGLGILSLLLVMYGLANLPLSEVITISYGVPFFIVLFGSVFLNEKVGLVRWFAVILGLVGVLIVMWPRLTMISFEFRDGDHTLLATLGMAFSCVAGAMAMLALRRLGSTEGSTTMALYFFMISATAGGASALFTLWVLPPLHELAALLAAGVAGGCAQLLLAECYKHADLSTIAPFEYASIIISICLGIVFFGESPTLSLLVGAFFVIVSGLLALAHESRRRRSP